MPHECEVFRRDEDVEAMMEFTRWLREGGMDSLREMKQCSDEYKTVKEMGFKALMKLLGAGLLLLFGFGVYAVTGRILDK